MFSGQREMRSQPVNFRLDIFTMLSRTYLRFEKATSPRSRQRIIQTIIAYFAHLLQVVRHFANHHSFVTGATNMLRRHMAETKQGPICSPVSVYQRQGLWRRSSLQGNSTDAHDICWGARPQHTIMLSHPEWKRLRPILHENGVRQHNWH